MGSWASHLLLAVVAYVPQLMAQPGVVSSDTKTYLYLDINRFIPASASMWDPTVGLGTVTHQQIGYLFPMGPFFWFFHTIGVPVWVAQRLWVGTILFAAGAGVLFLCRTLALRGLGPLVAAFAYMFSPYFLQYVGRISVLLLPWAGLPWMVALAALAVRRGGWRDSARFAVVVALVSSINATSLLYVGLGPALWLVYSVVGLREATWRQAGAAALKLAGMSLVVSFWWIAGLAVEGGFGVAILQTTETVQTVSQTSTPIEVLRGLGYWYFYGTDRLGPWVSSSVQLTQEVVPLAFGFAVPALAFVAAVFTRWRYRAFFVLLVLMGLVLAVGTYPFADPTWLGHALKAFMTETSAGLALRSTDRATPLLALGIAMLLGAGVSALGQRSRPFALGARRPVGGHGGRGQSPRLQRFDRRRQVHAARPAPRLHPGRGEGPEPRGGRHQGPGHPRVRLRQLRLRGHHRPRVPGHLEPGVRQPRAGAAGIDGDRGSPVRPRRSDAGGSVEPRRPRPDRPPHERG